MRSPSTSGNRAAVRDVVVERHRVRGRAELLDLDRVAIAHVAGRQREVGRPEIDVLRQGDLDMESTLIRELGVAARDPRALGVRHRIRHGLTGARQRQIGVDPAVRPADPALHVRLLAGLYMKRSSVTYQSAFSTRTAFSWLSTTTNVESVPCARGAAPGGSRSCSRRRSLPPPHRCRARSRRRGAWPAAAGTARPGRDRSRRSRWCRSRRAARRAARPSRRRPAPGSDHSG